MNEDIEINASGLYKFEQKSGKDILTVHMKAHMLIYVMDSETKKLLSGNNRTKDISTYRMVFERESGSKTSEFFAEPEMKNCSNCGAPLIGTKDEKCEYCSTKITSYKNEWTLINLQDVI